jgi:CRISPR-associated protein Csb2
MLAFGIRYLNGFSAASEFDQHDRAEWPPHPGRVFMAMAAAHFQTGEAAKEREALEWLETLNAPHIHSSEAISRAVVKHFVPVNDHNHGYKLKNNKVVVFQEIGQTGIRRERQDRGFARAWPEHDIVWLLWPDAQVEDSVKSALSDLCAKVTRIGHSSSMVQMWVARPDEVGKPNWVPDEDRAVLKLRIVTPGTLQELERRYNGQAVEAYASLKATAEDDSDKKVQKLAKERLKEEFSNESPPQLRPRLSFTQGYVRSVACVEALSVPGTVFDSQPFVLRLEPENTAYRYLDLACMPALAQRWREALLSQSNDLPGTVRKILSGHDANGAVLEEPHLAFLPLAFVGHQHADGHLLGIGLALPVGLSRDDRLGVLTAVRRVRELKLGRLGVWRVEAETREAVPWNLRPETWTAYPDGHTHWSTVTPVVYDRHPKANDKAAYLAEVAVMIRQACMRVGLPEPHEVIVTPVCAHLGVPPAHAFPRLRRKDDSLRRHTHAILVFGQPVRGPVLLGAGRYRGYGCCRPMFESVSEA